MEAEFCIAQLKNHALTIRSLVTDISKSQVSWKPDVQTWSILEVLCHLLDEERQDFRVRLEYILYRPGEAWPPIDPQGWVTERKYNQQDLGETLKEFSAERRKSLEWLDSLGAPDWKTANEAPWGTIQAGDMLAAWAAHDVLHIRQMVELHWAYLEKTVSPFTTRYAGEW